jgi:hypothetical protein
MKGLLLGIDLYSNLSCYIGTFFSKLPKFSSRVSLVIELDFLHAVRIIIITNYKFEVRYRMHCCCARVLGRTGHARCSR